jgi:type IV pilus assembly protein PilE
MAYRGFSLVEVLVALAIVAILSAAAWPGYSATLRRAQRNDARLALLRIQSQQESHYARHLRYASRLGGPADADTLPAAGRSDAGHYTLSLATREDGQGYSAIATARTDDRQARDRGCRQLAVDETGRRRSADAAGHWFTTDPHRCWG